MFSFITTFIDGFRFITRNEVDLQQDHEGARVRRNTIIPGSKGFNFKTNAHLSISGSSSRGCYVKVKSRDDSGGGFSFACAAWGP
jgi:hypothetical protein